MVRPPKEKVQRFQAPRPVQNPVSRQSGKEMCVTFRDADTV